MSGGPLVIRQETTEAVGLFGSRPITKYIPETIEDLLELAERNEVPTILGLALRNMCERIIALEAMTKDDGR